MNPQPAEVLRIVKLKVLFEFVTGLVALLVFPFGGAASAEESLRGIVASDVLSIHIEPEVVRLGGKNRQHQVLVTGQFADGTRLVSETNLSVVISEPPVVEQ